MAALGRSDAGGAAAASLIADRGTAAAAEDFFRCRQFHEAEGVTHSLRIESEHLALVAPLIVREIPGATGLDATSPYGYPGLVPPPRPGVPEVSHAIGGKTSGTPAGWGGFEALDPAGVDFGGTGLVSLFLRHRLGQAPLAGATTRNVVQIADPAQPLKLRGSDRNQINKNRRRGYALQLVPGPRTTAEQRAGFLCAYEQTMRRTQAGERYFFGAAYFDCILESAQTTLALAIGPDGEPAAGSIAARSDGFLHYYLSGTADRYLRDSPMKNIVAELIDLAAEESLPLNLGGGITRGDRLEEFKRGFANREEPWRSSEIVCDRPAYELLSAGSDAAGFFPAYRAAAS